MIYVRARQFIARDGLKNRAGDGEVRTDEHGGEDARQAYVPHDQRLAIQVRQVPDPQDQRGQAPRLQPDVGAENRLPDNDHRHLIGPERTLNHRASQRQPGADGDKDQQRGIDPPAQSTAGRQIG